MEWFIMHCDKDKIEQLLRESYKDRPKSEVDLNLISTEPLSEEKLRKKEEDKKKMDEERIKKSMLSCYLVMSEPTAFKQEMTNYKKSAFLESTIPPDVIEAVNYVMTSSK